MYSNARQPNSFGSKRGILSILLGVTVAVFVLQVLTLDGSQTSWITRALAIETDLVMQKGQVWRLTTSLFCHNEISLSHIIFNMMALYFLGRPVVNLLGDREFLWMYLAAGTCASMVQVCFMALTNGPGQSWALGASGAIMAIFMIFYLHYPHTRLYLFGFIPLRCQWVMWGLLAYDGLGLLGLMPSSFFSGGSVGHASHLGGMAFGFLYVKGDMRITRLWDRISGPAKRTAGSRSGKGPSLKVYQPEEQPTVRINDRVDEILSKISENGEASLSARDRRILQQASQQMRGPSS